MGRLFSNTLIYRTEFCFPSITTKSAFPDAENAPQTITDPRPHGPFETAASPFLNHANNTGSRRAIQIKLFLIIKHHGFPFLHCPCYFFFTQSTRIFLCLVVKAGAVILFQYKTFGDLCRSWQTLLFSKSLELDRLLEASRKNRRRAAFVILGGQHDVF